jgi:simple sugar transport system ATP-binding protein
VIRRGKTVGTRVTAETTSSELAELMVGRQVSLRVERPPAQPTDPALEVSHLTLKGHHGLPVLNDLSLHVRHGEIVGICGVEGNGQAELIESIAGLRKPDSGSIHISGNDVTGWNPIQLHKAGLSYIPEDRHHRGLVLPFSLTENMLLGNADDEPFSRNGVVDYGRSAEITET